MGETAVEPHRWGTRRPGLRSTAVAPMIVVGAAVVATTVRLSTPGEIHFDEVHYVTDARDILEHGVEQRSAVHPPVGPRIIAASIWLLGDHPLGWRAPAALAGILTVWLTYLLVRRLVTAPVAAAFAALLLVLDGVFLVQARIAMLDIFLAMFVVLAVWLFVVDHQRRTRVVPRAGPPTAAIPWALLGSGAALGLATAVKWSGLFALGAVAALAVGFQAAHLRRQGVALRRAWRTWLWSLAGLVALPAVVYVASWTPWLAAYDRTDAGREVCQDVPPEEACLAGPVEHAATLVAHHRRVVAFHTGLESDHRYQASPTTWPLQLRPVNYLWDRCDDQGLDRDEEPCAPPGRATQILALGNLAVWWSGLLALPVLVGGAVRGQMRSLVPLTLLLGQYLPWLFVGRATFSFYAVPMVPFLTAGIAIAVLELDRARRWRGLLVGGGAGLAVGTALAAAAWWRSAPDLSTGSVVVIAAVLVGAAFGGLRDRRAEAVTPPQPPRRRWRAGVIGALILLAAIALFTYFAPIWFGLPAETAAIRARWWLSSWV